MKRNKSFLYMLIESFSKNSIQPENRDYITSEESNFKTDREAFSQYCKNVGNDIKTTIKKYSVYNS